MLNIPMLTAAGFTDEALDNGKLFMRRDLEEVGNLTIHSKAFVSCHDGEAVNAYQSVNVYVTDGNHSLCEYTTSNKLRNFISTEEALSALGFGADRFRQSV